MLFTIGPPHLAQWIGELIEKENDKLKIVENSNGSLFWPQSELLILFIFFKKI